MKDSFIDKIVSRLDRLDSNNIQSYIQRLSREKGFLEMVFNTIKEGIIVIDRRLKVKYANKSAIDLLGFPENIEDQKVWRYIRDVDWRHILRSVETGVHRVSHREIEIQYPTRRVIGFYIVPLEIERGTAAIILNDVTDSRRAERENLETEKILAISRLAAGVAHEIGNPLNSLNIHLQLLKRHFASSDDQEAKELVTVAQGEVERLDAIITRFLSAIRPSKPKLERTDISQVMLETINFAHYEFESRSIKVSCVFPDYVPLVMGDADQLKQAFYNLLKNAAEAMPEGGEIGVACVVDDRWLRITVSDTGVGIAQKDIANLFEPYFTMKQNGTGLGLMVVERIARDHGAELTVESAPGKGAVFTVSFPRFDKRPPLLSAPKNDDDAEPASGRGTDHS